MLETTPLMSLTVTDADSLCVFLSNRTVSHSETSSRMTLSSSFLSHGYGCCQLLLKDLDGNKPL